VNSKAINQIKVIPSKEKTLQKIMVTKKHTLFTSRLPSDNNTINKKINLM